MTEIIYGVRNIDEKIVSIDEIPVNMSGLACNCVCAFCGRNLQACSLQGKVRRYFRHNNGTSNHSDSNDKFSCNPSLANETALHKMAKQIIVEEKKIMVPRKEISIDEVSISDLPQEVKNGVSPYEIQKPKMVYAESIELEKRLAEFTPDIAIKTTRGELLVEIFVTHQVDHDKRKKAQEYGAAMLEIDISDFHEVLVSSEKIREIILNDDVKRKKWAYYPLTNNALAKARDYFENANTIKQYRREARNKNRRNNKIKCLFQPNNYAIELKRLRDDSAFLEFCKKHYKPYWFSFEKYYQKNKKVPFFIDIPISGEMIFQCDRRIWQSVIFNRYVYGRKEVGRSFNIDNIYDDLRNDYGIAVDYDLSYKLINPLDEERSIWLRKEVIDKYINYLEMLGFITSREDDSYNEDGTWASVNAIKTITPPHKQASEYLQYVIKSVNQYSPETNRLIEEKMSEYKEILVQELIEEHNQRVAERERKIRKANERYETQMRERAKQEEEEKQRELLIQKHREKERNKAKYNDGLHDVESLDFSLPIPRYDRYGNRWARCNVCNCIKRDDELVSYQFGTGECNVCGKD